MRTGLGLGALAVGGGFLLPFIADGTWFFAFLLLWVGWIAMLQGSAIIRGGGGFIAALIVLSISAGLSRDAHPSAPISAARTTVAPRPAPKPAPEPSDQIALISARGYESEYGNYHYVEGQVKNISDQPMRNVEVVASWFAKDGTFIKSDSAIIEYNPIMPGQTSPFKTMTSGNPQMARYSVAFKTLMGGETAPRDDRKK